MNSKNTICLWYDNAALEAATFYAETFPDSAVLAVHSAPGDYPSGKEGDVLTVFPDSAVLAVHSAPGDYPSGKEGDVLTVEFRVMGIPCLGLNGGPAFRHSEAFSFQVATDDQAETDRLWNAIVDNGGEESACGWCRDKWGISWQITPRVLSEAIASPDRAAARRAFEAMMTMGRIDIATIEKAFKG
ncbi:VOC family protein [Pseudomonas aeruginosa]